MVEGYKNSGFLDKVFPVKSLLKVGLLVGQKLFDGSGASKGQETGSWTANTGFHAVESLCLQQLLDNGHRFCRDIYSRQTDIVHLLARAN